MSPLLVLRRIAAHMTPAGARTRCAHCGMPWGDVGTDRHGHTVWDLRNGHGPQYGTFVVCEWCWPRTTRSERLRYAADLVFNLWPAAGIPAEDCARDWGHIARAYLEAP